MTQNNAGSLRNPQSICESSYYQTHCRDVKCVWDPDAGGSGKCVEEDVEGEFLQCGEGLTFSRSSATHAQCCAEDPQCND